MKERRKIYQNPWEVLDHYAPGVKLSHLPFFIVILLLFGGLGWYVGKHPRVQEPIKKRIETPEAQEKIKAWKAWSEKDDEIRREISQVTHELDDTATLTEEEMERYETDQNFQRDVTHKINVATEKLNEVYKRHREHKEKRPPFPGVQSFPHVR